MENEISDNTPSGAPILHDQPISGLPEARLFTIVGEVDVHTTSFIKARLQAVLQDVDTRFLLVDMHGVPYMDSTGFGVLLGAVHVLKPEGGSVHLVGCTDLVRRVLEITSLVRALPIHDTLIDAISAVREEIRTNPLPASERP